MFIKPNQDHSFFMVVDKGFQVYDCETFEIIVNRNDIGDFKQGSMLFKTNLVALIGTDTDFPSNKVLLWDDLKGIFIGELQFNEKVLSVLMRRDCIVVVLLHVIWVYDFPSLDVLYSIKTMENKNAICNLSAYSGHYVLACPGLQMGQIRIDLEKHSQHVLNVHKQPIECMALSYDGNFLATTSTTGKKIRVFGTLFGNELFTLQRGLLSTKILSLGFNHNNSCLICVSGTSIHIFMLVKDVTNTSIVKLPTLSNQTMAWFTSYTNHIVVLDKLKKTIQKYYFNDEKKLDLISTQENCF